MLCRKKNGNKGRPLPSLLDLRRGQGRLCREGRASRRSPGKRVPVPVQQAWSTRYVTRTGKKGPIDRFLKPTRDIPSLRVSAWNLSLKRKQLPRQLAENKCRHDASLLVSPPLASKLLREFLLSLVGFWVAAPSFVPPLPGGRRPLTHSPRREVGGPAHTRGAHPTASGRLKTVVLFRQSHPALTNGGVVDAVVPCGT